MNDAESHDERPEPPAKTVKRHQGLGRGLSALFAETKRDVAVAEAEAAPADEASQRSVRLIDVAAISPHPDQPRRLFDEKALEELATSIAARGIIQPIIVRPAGNRFQIVAGERRWRAAQKARLHQIPAIVRDFDEAETLEIALVENIQREDLNPIEEAQAYNRLVAQFGHSQDALGRLVGKSRSHVANLMRLLDLPQAIQDQLTRGEIQMGHARALIGVADGELLAEEIAKKGLSVREIEKRVRTARGRSVKLDGDSQREPTADADIYVLERDLGDVLGMRLSIAHGADGKGSVTIQYSTLDQLDMLCQRLSGEAI